MVCAKACKLYYDDDSVPFVVIIIQKNQLIDPNKIADIFASHFSLAANSYFDFSSLILDINEKI